MLRPTTAQNILTNWALKPLDFEPGTRWQYSNTNFVIAGLIAERTSGMPLLEFLQQRVFGPLGMASVYNIDANPLPAQEPVRYQRFGLGPLRVAPKEGAGWLFAAGELAMTAADLAKWDMSVINQTILKPSSYREMQREVLLSNGAGSHYGLGVFVNMVNGRRVISHGGEVSGFTTQNAIYPDEHCAVVALVNLDATDVPKKIASKVAEVMFLPLGNDGPLTQAKNIFTGLQHGRIDRARFSPNADAYFSEQALRDLASSLGPLGQPLEFSFVSEGARGGMIFQKYSARFAKKSVAITIYTLPDGKLEQYVVAAE